MVLGGALGDVLGGIPERRSLTFSDDTQLTIATCEAIVINKRVDPEKIAQRMLAWFCEGRVTGIGASTLKAMRDLQAGAHWALSGARGERAAGNGAAMRIAPLAFFLDPAIPHDRTVIRDVARITHHHEEAYIGALAVVLAIRLLASGETLSYSRVASQLPDSRVRDQLFALAESASSEPLATIANRFGSSGFVAETVPLAFEVARRMQISSFESVIYEMNNAGGDTDTIGAIAGQLAGIVLGPQELPIRYLGSIPAAPYVRKVAEDFANVALGAN